MQIRIDDALQAWILAHAEAAELPPSVYIRKVLAEKAARSLTTPASDAIGRELGE